MPPYHIPVLSDEIAALAVGRGRVVDCTVGGGGHAERLLAAGVELLAIDRDPQALEAAQARLGSERAQWLNMAFADPRALAAVARFEPDFVLMDLGVSGHQLDDNRRGFTFRPGAPLDMRMTPEAGVSAADLLNKSDAAELTRIFRAYGDERRAKRLAATIVRRRHTTELATSDDLVNAIRAALGPRTGPSDFARLFQAIRIAVNDELLALEKALPAFLDSLLCGGMIAVVSYHSGEDRVVKQLFRAWASSCVCPPGQPICNCRGKSLGTVDPKKPVYPSEQEMAANPRARSAKLRVFRKADAS